MAKSGERTTLFLVRLLGPLPRQDGWLLRDGRAQGLAAVVLLLFANYALVFYSASVSSSFDFMAFWSFGRMLHEHPASDLYNVERLLAFQASLGFDTTKHWLFAYPPVFMMVAWPLGLLPPSMALRVWSGTTLVAFVWAAVGNRPRLAALSLALLCPATTLGVIAGQNGFLSGALLLGGLRLIGTRPWLGGLLIALLTYKPQLGFMVPFALAAAGAWRGIAAACVWMAVLAALTCGLFGPTIWTDWLSAMPEYSAAVGTANHLLWMQPTVVANLQLAGLSRGLAMAVQAALAAAMAVVVWRTWRSGTSAPAVGVLVAATFIATPYAFFYDLPMITAAVLYLGIARLQAGTLGMLEAAFLLMVLCIPAFMVASERPVSLPILLAFAAWAAWRATPGYAAANCSSASRAYSPP